MVYSHTKKLDVKCSWLPVLLFVATKCSFELTQGNISWSATIAELYTSESSARSQRWMLVEPQF